MASTFELFDGSTTINLQDGTNYSVRDIRFGIAPAETTFAGMSLRGYRYRPRTITATVRLTDTTAANLLTRVRAVEDMLNVAKERQVRGYGTIVVLKTQIGDTGANDIEYRILAGTLRVPDLLRQPLRDRGELPAAELSLVVEPLGRLATITGTALEVENEQDGSGNNFVDLFGPFNGYLNFDGVDDDVTVTDQAAIQNIFDGGGTVEAWVYAKSDGESNAGRILTKTSGWNLRVQSEASGKAKVAFDYDFSTTDGTWVTTATELTLNEWHRVSVEYDADSTSNDPIISIDGFSVALTEVSTPDGTRITDVGDDLIVGGDGAGALSFDGYIDDVRLWSDTRTQTEILDNWHKELVGNEAGLAGYWPLNDSAGTVAKDSTSNGNDGAISGATFGILDAERSGDEESLLQFKIHDANNGGGNAWSGDKTMWVAKRTGERRTDTLFYQAPDATVAGTNPYSPTSSSFTSPAGLTTNASGGTSQAARWSRDSGTLTLSGSRVSCAYFRYDIAGGSIPKGLFRVLARVSIEFSSPGEQPDAQSFGFALGWSFGANSYTPVTADDVDMEGSSEDEWHTLDLGSLVLTPNSVPDGFTEPTLEIRVYCIWDHGSTRANQAVDAYVEWTVDCIYLLPVDEGSWSASSVGTDDRLLADMQSEVPGIYELNGSDVVQQFATKTGGPFNIGPEPTRIYVIRDDVGDPPVTQFTATPTYIPQVTGF